MATEDEKSVGSLCCELLLVEYCCTHDLLGDSVRVAVGRWTPILHVAVAVFADLTRNTHRGASVSDAGREVVDAAGFMVSCETSCIVTTITRVIRTNVSFVVLAQLLNRFFNQPVDHKFTDNSPALTLLITMMKL